jgi:hypothetical protein
LWLIAYQEETAFDRSGTIEWRIVEQLEKGKFPPLPVRWIMKRTFAWLVIYEAW